MKSYQVHVYAIVRVKVENVVADSPAHATELVQKSVDLDALFENTSCDDPQITQVEYAGDVQDFVVDEIEDGEVVEQHNVDRQHRPA